MYLLKLGSRVGVEGTEGRGELELVRNDSKGQWQLDGRRWEEEKIGFGLPNVPFKLIQRLSTNNRGFPGALRSLSPNPGSLSIVPHAFLR